MEGDQSVLRRVVFRANHANILGTTLPVYYGARLRKLVTIDLDSQVLRIRSF